MTVGYSGTPLWQKIGITPDARVALRDMPKHVPRLLAGVPPHAHVEDDAAIAWAFVTDDQSLRAALVWGQQVMRQDGMLWLSWPKKTSALHTGLLESHVRDAGLAAGLVDVKVCAVDEDWSGLKFVVPVANRV